MGLRPPAASAALSRSSSMPLPLGSLALLAIGSLTAVLGKHRGRGAKVRVRVAPRPKVLRLAAVASEAAAPTSVDEDLVCLATVVSFSAPPLLLKAPLPHSAPLAGTAEGEKARGLGCSCQRVVWGGAEPDAAARRVAAMSVPKVRPGLNASAAGRSFRLKLML